MKMKREIEKGNKIKFIVHNSDKCGLLSGTVHTRVEVYRTDLEMCRLVERPWLQLMYCAICLPYGYNFR